MNDENNEENQQSNQNDPEDIENQQRIHEQERLQEEERLQAEYDKKLYFEEISQRVREVLMVIRNTKKLIDDEKLLREEAEARLQVKSEEIKAIIVKQNMTTTEKVEMKMRQTLEEVVNGTITKQNQLRDYKANLQERLYLNTELERQFIGLRYLNLINQRHYTNLTEKELQESDEHVQRLRVQLQKQTNMNAIAKSDIDDKSQKIKQLSMEAQNLRAQIQSLSDVKKVLNRVQGASERTKQPDVIIQEQRKSSYRQNSSGVRQKPPPNVKQNYNEHDVEDNFWYGSEKLKLPPLSQQSKNRQY
ncbi:hypothetical protein pb186bvf_018247 [Paramecium bursaria]